MENGLFRKKSMERISSPEELHDYMRVTSPRLWMLLAAILILLAGFIVYASTATIENVLPVRVHLQSYSVSPEEDPEADTRNATFVFCRLPLNNIDLVKTGMKLRFGKEEGHVTLISASEEDETIDVFFDMDREYIPMKDGEYDAELILESTTPISFLWN